MERSGNVWLGGNEENSGANELKEIYIGEKEEETEVKIGKALVGRKRQILRTECEGRARTELK